MRRRRGGFTLIEVLAASLIVGTCMAAIVTTWSFAYNLMAKTSNETTAYNLARRALEEVRQTGFQDSTEGTTTVYYDSAGGNRSATATGVHTFTVLTTIATDVMSGSSPASTALRTVTVTVKLRSTDATVYTCSTYMARAGT